MNVKITTIHILGIVTAISIPFHEVEPIVLLWVLYGLYRLQVG